MITLDCIRLETLQKISEFNWKLLPHPAYSPDIASSDFHLFRALQNFLLGKKLNSKQDVQNELSSFFASKPESFYSNGINTMWLHVGAMRKLSGKCRWLHVGAMQKLSGKRRWLQVGAIRKLSRKRRWLYCGIENCRTKVNIACSV